MIKRILNVSAGCGNTLSLSCVQPRSHHERTEGHAHDFNFRVPFAAFPVTFFAALEMRLHTVLSPSGVLL